MGLVNRVSERKRRKRKKRKCVEEPTIEPAVPSNLDELGMKLCAQIMLRDHRDKVIVPTKEEWVGLCLLERDGELCRSVCR